MKYIRLFEAGDRVVVLEYGGDNPVVRAGVVEDTYLSEFVVRLDDDPDTLYPFTLYSSGEVRERRFDPFAENPKRKLMFAE